MESDFKKNIVQMEGFLNRKHISKQDAVNPRGAAVTHLERMSANLVRDSKIIDESALIFPSQGENFRSIIHNHSYVADVTKLLEDGFMSSFSDHQRKLIVSLIKILLLMHKVKGEDIETTTMGILEDMGFTVNDPKKMKGKATVESQTIELQEMRNRYDFTASELNIVKSTLETLAKKAGMNPDQIQNVFNNINNMAQNDVDFEIPSPTKRGRSNLAENAELDNEINSSNKKQLVTMLNNTKEAYELLSSHHDTILEKVTNYQKDMKKNVEKAVMDQSEIDYYKDKIEKQNDHIKILGLSIKEIVVLDKGKRKTLFNMNNTEYQEKKKKESERVSFNNYIIKDVSDFIGKINKFHKKTNANTDEKSKTLSNLLINDLSNKSKIEKMLEETGTAEDDQYIYSYDPIGNLVVKDKFSDKLVSPKEYNNLGINKRVTFQNAVADSPLKKPSHLDLSKGGLGGDDLRLSVSKTPKNVKGRTPTNKSGGRNTLPTEESEISGRTISKTKKKINKASYVDESSEEIESPSKKRVEKKTKQGSIIITDKNSKEGTKLVGLRSKKYTVDRGGIKISVNDMGCNTEITGDDMAMGITAVKPDVLMGSDKNKNGNKGESDDYNLLSLLPNAKPTIQKDEKTGETVYSFDLKTGHVLKLSFAKGPDINLTKNGLRGLVALLCKELGVDDLWSLANQAQVTAVHQILKDPGVDINQLLKDNKSLEDTIKQKVQSNKDSNYDAVDLFDDSDDANLDKLSGWSGMKKNKKNADTKMTPQEIMHKRLDMINDLPREKKQAFDKFLKFLSKNDIEILGPKLDELFAFINQVSKYQTQQIDGNKPVAMGVSTDVIKELQKQPEVIRDELADIATELGKNTGGKVQLDVSRLSEKQKKVLMEKPPEVRKLDDLVKDKEGNLIDKKTGKVVVDKKQAGTQVKDNDGNLVDKITGKVVFDSTGQLAEDKVKQEEFIKIKEEVKQEILKSSIKQKLASGDKIEGFILDEKTGELKQVDKDGAVTEFKVVFDKSPEKKVSLDTLMKEAKKVQFTNKDIILNKKDLDGTKKADQGANMFGKKNKNGLINDGRQSSTNDGSYVNNNRVNTFNSYDGSSQLPGYNQYNPRAGQNMRGNKSTLHMQKVQEKLNSDPNVHALRNNVERVLNNPNATEDEKKQAKQQLQTYFNEQQQEMPNLYQQFTEEELANMSPDDIKQISDSYNPLVGGNQNNPEFYKKLYKVYKISRVADGNNLQASKFIGTDGAFNPDFEGNEFLNFQKEIVNFTEKHMDKCGPTCKHLMRFYQKIGFYPYGKYDNKYYLRLRKVNMDSHKDFFPLPKLKKNHSMVMKKAANLNTTNYEITKEKYKVKRMAIKKFNSMTGEVS